MIDFTHIEKYRENNRIEAKLALGGLPHSIWETYSAFANTLGGIILLGVEEAPDKTLHPVNLPAPEVMCCAFWEMVNDPKKVSSNILRGENVTIEETDGKRIIAIRVPRARRCDRPVYIDGDPLCGTYRRNGEGDYRCTPEEVHAMQRAALAKVPDIRPIKKEMIVTYLTSHVTASLAEIAALLDLTPRAARHYVNELIEAGILTAIRLERKKYYRLK